MTVPEHSAPLPLHPAFDAIGCALVILDGSRFERPISAVNAAFTALTGYAAEEVRGRSILLLAGRESDPQTQHDLLEALAELRAFSAEWCIYDKDGLPRWTRVTVRPTTAAPGAQCIATFEDIAAHKRARQSLRASDARLNVAMEASALAMWDWSVDRDEVYYNDEWRTLLSLEPRELLKRRTLHERLLLPNDAALLERFEQHLQGAAANFAAEYQLPTGTGEQKWVAAFAKVTRRASDGRAQRVIGVLRDISGSRRGEQEALDVERRWERAVRGTLDGLYDWDLNSGYVWYAARFREIVGYEDKEFPDTFQAFQNVLHAEDRALVLDKIRAHLEGHGRLDLRCRVVTRNGAQLWCRLRGDADRDAAGRPLRLSGSLSDVDAQVEAEDALARSQDFYGTILDSLPLYIAYTDSDERIVYANQMFQAFFEQPLADGRGRTIHELIGAQPYAEIRELLRQALSGVEVEGHGRFRDAKGKHYDLEAAFIPHRGEDGAIQGCFIAARDMTERRQLEAELRQSQKMEAVGRLTGGVAHDFNNLLSVVIGNVQLLSRSLRDSPRLLRQSETALKAAMRGAELTQRLLAFARQQVLESKIVDPNALLSGMYDLMRRTLTNEIDIRQQLDPDAWPTKVDPGQLENAVLNLVINARDAMPQGGVITIATRNVTIAPESAPDEGGASPGDYTVLAVTDTGVGMPPDVLKRVFEPFFTTKEVGKGSGLGLSMVYGFVRQSGGAVQITSTVQQGTTVQLYFPRTHSRARQNTLQTEVAAELPRGSELLLVVEDHLEVRMTAVEILRTLGYQVLEAVDGRQALEQFALHPHIDLVFCDVMLPGGLLGAQLVQRLREQRPAVKVLMTTGFSGSAVLGRGVLDGSLELLPKPYRVEELARRIRVMLDGSQENARVQART